MLKYFLWWISQNRHVQVNEHSGGPRTWVRCCDGDGNLGFASWVWGAGWINLYAQGIRVFLDLPAALMDLSLLDQRILGSFSLITGLSLKNKAFSIRKSQDYGCLINSILSSSCILKWCFIRTPFCSGHSIFWAYICIWPLVTFTSHYTMPSLMTDVSSKDRLIIFNIFISFFGTHFPSIQTLHNFNEFHILLGHVGIIHSVQREFEAQRDLCQKILINFGYSLSSLYIF